MNTPVSFSLVKLLKEKRFDEPCISFYDLVSNQQINNAPLGNYNLTKQSVSIPTIIDVVMWLYKNHKIWISVDPENDTNTWFHTISHGKSTTVFGNYSTLTEAYEAGIDYTLNNLIC